jgi:hypothetical protein
MVLLPEQTTPNFFPDQPQCGARFLQMLARLVDGRVFRLPFTGCNRNGQLDLFPANSTQSIARSFVLSKLIAHKTGRPVQFKMNALKSKRMLR